MEDTQVEPFAYTCPKCKQPVLATIVGVVAFEEPPVKPRKMKDTLPGMEALATRAVLVECQTCRSPSLLAQALDDTDYETWYPYRLLWPYPGRPVSDHVPPDIRADFNEARACLAAGAPTASAVMVRRALEGVCKDQGAGKQVLAQSLDELGVLGKIDGRLLEWAHGLRALGNSAAHSTARRTSLEDAGDALAFLEALLDYLYVLAAQFAVFQERRKNPHHDKPPF